MSPTQQILYKIVILGDGGVGKTTLLHRYVDGKFISDTKMTIGTNFFVKKIEFPEEDAIITLQIWDLGGQAHFASIRSSFYRGARGVIYTFDLTRMLTLKNLTNWKQELEDVVGQQKSILVGNKLDLINPDKRIIDPSFVTMIKDILKATDYYETSAKDNIMVNKVFRQIAYEIYKS
ncbi:MAG: GTP-binding protein [Candidatus Lokiarchaeota archaeon]|nr:GTP-binding protein [Candidatus Lokiarchaeota archaeon]